MSMMIGTTIIFVLDESMNSTSQFVLNPNFVNPYSDKDVDQLKQEVKQLTNECSELNETILDLTDNLIANEGHVTETKSSLIANNGYITEKIKETVNG